MVQLKGTQQKVLLVCRFVRYSDGAPSGVFQIGHSRGTISAAGVTSQKVVELNDRLMRLEAIGDTGNATSSLRQAARIDVEVANAPAQIGSDPNNIDMPGRMVFGTTRVGGASSTLNGINQ